MIKEQHYQIVEVETVEESYNHLLRKAEDLQQAYALPISKAISNSDFKFWPASIDKHHCYTGGLVVHTSEVLDIALKSSNARHMSVDKDVLAIAAIYHDIGKIRDYRLLPAYANTKNHKGWLGVDISKLDWFEKTPFRYNIRHIPYSYHLFMCDAEESNCNADFIDSVSHCILSHHGRKEWGSPIEPNSAEAYILHFADMMSVYCCKAL